MNKLSYIFRNLNRYLIFICELNLYKARHWEWPANCWGGFGNVPADCPNRCTRWVWSERFRRDDDRRRFWPVFLKYNCKLYFKNHKMGKCLRILSRFSALIPFSSSAFGNRWWAGLETVPTSKSMSRKRAPNFGLNENFGWFGTIFNFWRLIHYKIYLKRNKLEKMLN